MSSDIMSWLACMQSQRVFPDTVFRPGAEQSILNSYLSHAYAEGRCILEFLEMQAWQSEKHS